MICSCQPASNPLLKLTTERLKVLKIIGESIGQVVVENTVEIDAVKIVDIVASVKDLKDHIFKNKIVKQGTIHKQVFYVAPDGVVHETNENVPFTVVVEIPGVDRDNPWLEIEDKVLKIETDHELERGKCHDHEPGLLKQKIVVDILVKVSEWVQLDVVVKPNFNTKINPLNTIVIRSQ